MGAMQPVLGDEPNDHRYERARRATFAPRLAAMYRNNYHKVAPDRLRKELFDYVLFLELTISGNQIAECDERDFTIDEVEALNRD